MMLAPVLTLKAAAPLGVDAAQAAESAGSMSPPGEADDSEAAAARRLEVCAVLMSAAEAFGLQDCWQWKPLMDGKAVSNVCLCACLCYERVGTWVGALVGGVAKVPHCH